MITQTNKIGKDISIFCRFKQSVRYNMMDMDIFSFYMAKLTSISISFTNFISSLSPSYAIIGDCFAHIIRILFAFHVLAHIFRPAFFRTKSAYLEFTFTMIMFFNLPRFALIDYSTIRASKFNRFYPMPVVFTGQGRWLVSRLRKISCKTFTRTKALCSPVLPFVAVKYITTYFANTINNHAYIIAWTGLTCN